MNLDRSRHAMKSSVALHPAIGRSQRWQHSIGRSQRWHHDARQGSCADVSRFSWHVNRLWPQRLLFPAPWLNLLMDPWCGDVFMPCDYRLLRFFKERCLQFRERTAFFGWIFLGQQSAPTFFKQCRNTTKKDNTRHKKIGLSLHGLLLLLAKAPFTAAFEASLLS